MSNILIYQNKIALKQNKIIKSHIWRSESYIPKMTANNVPIPFIASGDLGSTTYPLYLAFDNDSGTYAYNDQGAGFFTYVQAADIIITLDKFIKVWKFDYKIRYTTNPTTFTHILMSLINGNDDVYGTTEFTTPFNDYSGSKEFTNPTSLSNIYKLRFSSQNFVSSETWNVWCYEFKIYGYY